MMSGLHKTNDHTFDESSTAMKERIRLIEGQITAGNNNEDLLKEAHKLLHGLSKTGVISTSKAAQHYKHLKSFF